MVDIVVAWKEGREIVEFCHDAGEGEYIDWGVVAGGSEEEFWCSIPSSGDIVGEGWS